MQIIFARDEHLEGKVMRIVIVGGTGLVGARLVKHLQRQGHDAIAASPRTGVNSVTGEGLAEVLKDASVIVDVTNPPSFDRQAMLDFFEVSTRNQILYGTRAGVCHHVVLSVVGTGRLFESPYLEAKGLQERLIRESGKPYSIIHATQFFEYAKPIADSSAVQEGKVRLPDVFVQPIAVDDVVEALGNACTNAPVNGTTEMGGPDLYRLETFVRLGLNALGDPREVAADSEALYFGAHVTERALVPDRHAARSPTRYENWLARYRPPQ
jgi:uncharacterized protein YbjT (DUF2867 family)